MHRKVEDVLKRAKIIKQKWEGFNIEDLDVGDIFSMYVVFKEMVEMLEKFKIAMPLPIFLERYKDGEEVLIDYFLYLRDVYIKNIEASWPSSVKVRRLNEVPLDTLHDFLRITGFDNRCLYCGKITKNIVHGLPFCNEEHYRELKKITSWHYVRKEYLKKHPICEICGEREAEEVHHIIRVVDGGEIFNEENLIAVCKECHKKLHSPIKKVMPHA